MKSLAWLILIAVYTLTANLTHPSKSFGPVVNVEIKHTHDDNHTHHSETDHQNHEHSVPHSHNVSVAMSGHYTVASVQSATFRIIGKANSMIFSPYREDTMEDPFFGSIFRPPIA